MSKLDEVKGYLGQKINGVSLNIDIINSCVLRCVTCAVGNISKKRNGAVMSIDLFRRILDKAERENKVRKVQFYAYSEAAMHPNLHLFVAECRKRGIRSNLSTMLQTTACDWAEVIEARPTELRISFPGWNLMSQRQNGAKPELFDRNMRFMETLPRYPETLWCSAMHLYNDNADEIPRVEQWARDNRLKLVVLPAIFMTLEKTVEGNYTPKDLETISHLLEHPDVSMARMKKRDYCDNWKQVTIDAEGFVYLCQLVYEDRFKMMNFLDVPLKEIQHAIRTHSFCGKCMKKGGQVYQECFAEFDHRNPIAEADKKRRLDPNYSPLQNL
jgi:MoaA/NifB/PqqE/SkfB family radical SAM enzyme